MPSETYLRFFVDQNPLVMQRGDGERDTDGDAVHGVPEAAAGCGGLAGIGRRRLLIVLLLAARMEHQLLRSELRHRRKTGRVRLEKKNGEVWRVRCDFPTTTLRGRFQRGKECGAEKSKRQRGQ